MTKGPGKYDAECEKVMTEIGAAGLCLIVFAGSKGNGWSMSIEPALLPVVHAILPKVLRSVADQIEKDTEHGPD